MDCLNTKCTIAGNDRMIYCWLCLGYHHVKCTALKACEADTLLEPGKSLHWTCSAYKNSINIDFYKFFKGYKAEFDILTYLLPCSPNLHVLDHCSNIFRIWISLLPLMVIAILEAN